jgi:hypothetical protein
MLINNAEIGTSIRGLRASNSALLPYKVKPINGLFWPRSCYPFSSHFNVSGCLFSPSGRSVVKELFGYVMSSIPLTWLCCMESFRILFLHFNDKGIKYTLILSSSANKLFYYKFIPHKMLPTNCHY